MGKVLPKLAGKLDGIVSRVPIPDPSLVDLFVELEQNIKIEDILRAVKRYSESKRMSNILQCSDGPILLSDIIGIPYPSIYDSECTNGINKNFVRTLNWYDN